MNGTLAGLVLCGGRSERMGTDKALLEIDGTPLVRMVASRLAAVADPVFLAPGEPGRLGPLGYREIADERGGSGPLGGIVAGLAASPHALMAVVAVDMPFASPDVFALLAGLHRGEQAVLPVGDRGLEPLHAVYSVEALGPLRDGLAEGRLALREAVSALRIRIVPAAEWRAADPTGRFAVNVNTAEDLARLR